MEKDIKRLGKLFSKIDGFASTAQYRPGTGGI